MKILNWCIQLSLVAVLTPSMTIYAQSTREIGYDPSHTIAERLRPGDSTVVVRKNATTPLIPAPGVEETFEQEIRRLANYETIATILVSGTQGAFSENGSWIRTRVDGQSTDLVKGGNLLAPAGSVQFWHDGGQLHLGSVKILAGNFPQFVAGQHYLVFLRTDQARNETYAALAFRVTDSGTLEGVLNSTGSRAWPLPSKIIGRSITDVSAAILNVR